MTLTARLTLAMLLLAVLTAGTIGLLTYRNLQRVILPTELRNMESTTTRLSAYAQSYLQNAGYAVLSHRNSSPVKGFVRARLAGGYDARDRSTEAQLRARMEQNFLALAQTWPGFTKIRLIGIADSGRELVRIERTAGEVVAHVVPEEQMQDKEDRPFFREAISAPDQTIVYSHIDLDQDFGAIRTPHIPNVRSSTPVHDESGQPFGALVINIDVRPMLEALRRELITRPGVHYLVNPDGDYLLHPDPAREFGFDMGKRYRLQDDLPEITAILQTVPQGAAVMDIGGISSAIAIAPIDIGGRRLAVLVSIVPRSQLLSQATEATRASWLGGAAAVLLAALLAFAVARSVTRPLGRVTAAIDAFGASEGEALRTGRHGAEVSDIADAFERMSHSVSEKTTALMESRAQLETVIESLDEGLVTADLQLRQFRWNRAALQMHGLEPTSPAALSGAEFRKTFALSTLDDVICPLEEWPINRVLRGEHLHNHLLRVQRRDSDWSRVFSFGGTIVRTADGKPLLALLTITDVTVARQAEESLRRKQRTEALGNLAGGIAHDFNNILLAIAGNAQLAAADLDPSHPAMTSLREITKASARATDLVQRILLFSRSQEPRSEVCDIAPVIEEALKLLRPTIPASIVIRTRVQDGLPHVAIDASQIHQVMLNLTANAAYAIGQRAPGRTGNIDIRLDAVTKSGNSDPPHDLAVGRYVRLTVSDDGCGMDAATVARIFDPFFTTKPVGQGTGLGLSVVHGIVSNHGGTITVSSEPGKGAAVAIYLPASPEAGIPEQALRPAVAQGHGQRIMYVDDEQVLVLLATRYLEKLGYRVTGFDDPGQAVEFFRQRPHDFDVVVTDLSMPMMSGFDLARSVLTMRPDIDIIMMSGYVRAEDREAALSAGVKEVILKPSTIEHLAQAVHRLLG